MPGLFKEFSPVSAAAWKEQIIKDLKGTALESLLWKNADGISIETFYTAENLHEKKTPLFSHSDWEMAVALRSGNEKEINATALKALNGGASALFIDVNENTDLIKALNEVQAEYIVVNFVVKTSLQLFLQKLNALIQHSKLDETKLRGAIIFDPLAHLVQTGEWLNCETAGLMELSGLQKRKTNLHTLCIKATLYHNAGATASFELACTLAHAHELLAKCFENGISPQQLKNKVWIQVAVGSDFFLEIAKVRALRKLWNIVAEQYQLEGELYIHCETSLLNKSILDPYNNMLRTTTEGMSAVIGGCDSLLIQPFDFIYKNENDFSRRMALNQQHILKEESYLNKVADIGAGSYYIETLTDQLAETAWEQFKNMESKGGWLNCMRSGFIQQQIGAQAAALQQNVREGKQILLGVNKFPNLKETLVEIEVLEPTVKTGSTEIKPLELIRLSKTMEQERLTVKQ